MVVSLGSLENPHGSHQVFILAAGTRIAKSFILKLGTTPSTKYNLKTRQSGGTACG